MDDDIAVSVKGIYKDFKLPHEKVGSLKSVFTGLLKGNTRLKYEMQHALKDISFDIKKGEFFGIVGRNGSGKSTLLKIIAQIYQPTKGTVRVNGRLVPFIELGVGFNPELTGRENVYLNGAILGFNKEKIDENYKSIVEFAELEEFMDQKLKNYSSGMQVRLAFACATKAEAEILLVDEVLAVGDSDFQRKCFRFFKELKKIKKTVIFVSHDMDAIAEYCDRAALIDQNKIKGIDTSGIISNQYRKLFLLPTPKETVANSVAENRWGDRSIAFEKISINNAKPEGRIHIHISYIVNSDITDPIFGFKLLNSSGTPLLGTNSKILGNSYGDLKKGTKMTLAWSFDNIFSDGEYTIEPAIVKSDGIDVCDWWEGAATFKIKKSRRSGYIVDPIITVESR
ncbi:MAG: ABC transporter ATP-binding protein [Patescibacteria group bacterium]